jgi:hypothetical protein
VLPLAALLAGLAAGQAQADPWADEEDAEAAERRERVTISAWGGNAWDVANQFGSSAAVFGGEIAYVFRSMDLGLAGYGYHLPDERRSWTPVGMVRLINRFPTGNGVEATFALGIGAARPDDWIAWFQVALGVRIDLGRAFVGGELSFEQNNLLRLAGGLGVKF